MGLKKKKKGVSPLIATVLLIAFAVALGAVVMNWGRTQFTDHSSVQGPCGEIDFGIEVMNSKPEICYSSGSVSVLLYNNGKRSIIGIKATMFSSSGDPLNLNLAETLSPAESKRITFDIPQNFGEIQKIRFIPEILPDPERPLSKEYCSSSIIEAIQPGSC